MKVPALPPREKPKNKETDWCRICRQAASPGCYVDGRLLPPVKEEE